MHVTKYNFVLPFFLLNFMNKFVRFSLEIYLIYMHVFLEFITYGMLFKFQFLEPVIVFLISTNNK